MRCEQSRDDVFAGRVDHIEQDDEQRDQGQIAAAEYKCESSSGFTAVDPQIEHRADRQQRGRNLQDDLRCHAQAKQAGGNQRPERGAGGHAHRDNGKETIAGFLPVEVVGERPELGDERHVEDADPDEEGHADIPNVRRNSGREHLDADDEEHGDADQQLDAVNP